MEQRKRLNGILKQLSLTLVCLVVAGCAGSRQFTQFPDQTAAVPENDLARIYVIRMRGDARLPVADGNKLIGDANAKHYLCWEREPGTATIIAGLGMIRLRSGQKTLLPKDSSVSFSYKGQLHTMVYPFSRNIKVEAGKTYFVLVDIPPGEFRSLSRGYIDLSVADEATGKALLAKSGKPRLKIQTTQ